MFMPFSIVSAPGSKRTRAAGDPALMRFRHYDPNIGRFTSFDVFEGDRAAPQSLHKYVYAHDDPIDFVDPSGERISLAGTALLFTFFTGILPLMFLYLRETSAWGRLRGTFVPVHEDQVSVLYHSVRIRGASKTLDEVFRAVATFKERSFGGEIRALNNVTGIGDEVQFSLYPLVSLGQEDFSVRITKFSATQHYFVARTLAGHPLAGWRYWGVGRYPNGDLKVETFAVEHPYGIFDELKVAFGGRESQKRTWNAFLNSVVRFSVGTEVPGADTILYGEEMPNADEYLRRVK